MVRPRPQPPPRRRDAEVEPGRGTRSTPVGPASSEREHRLGDHERDVALQPVAQPLALVGDAGRPAAGDVDETSSPSSSTGKRRTSSANGSKVPPVARSKRAWCQWQVRMPSLDACRGAAGSPCAGSGCRPRGPRRRRRTGRRCAGRRGRPCGRLPGARRARRRGRVGRGPRSASAHRTTSTLVEVKTVR